MFEVQIQLLFTNKSTTTAFDGKRCHVAMTTRRYVAMLIVALGAGIYGCWYLWSISCIRLVIYHTLKNYSEASVFQKNGTNCSTNYSKQGQSKTSETKLCQTLRHTIMLNVSAWVATRRQWKGMTIFCYIYKHTKMMHTCVRTCIMYYWWYIADVQFCPAGAIGPCASCLVLRKLSATNSSRQKRLLWNSTGTSHSEEHRWTPACEYNVTYRAA